jgi:hypothetical protein
MNAKRGSALLTMIAAVAVATPVVAQQAGQFAVTPHAAWVMYDDAAALDDRAGIGIDMVYGITPNIGIGAFVGVGRPVTLGRYFAPAVHTHPDTTFLYVVSQQVTQTDYGVLARFGLPLGGVAAALEAGVGRYTFFNDPEAFRGNSRFSGTSFVVGGGVTVQAGAGMGLHLGLRDLIYTGFERENLNAVDPIYRDTTWPDLQEGVPAPKETLHNLRVSLGFVFTPRGR